MISGRRTVTAAVIRSPYEDPATGTLRVTIANRNP